MIRGVPLDYRINCAFVGDPGEFLGERGLISRRKMSVPAFGREGSWYCSEPGEATGSAGHE